MWCGAVRCDSITAIDFLLDLIVLFRTRWVLLYIILLCVIIALGKAPAREPVNEGLQTVAEVDRECFVQSSTASSVVRANGRITSTRVGTLFCCVYERDEEEKMIF